MRLLLIEDDILLGEGIKSALAHFSYSVDWLQQGKPAIAALSHHDYQLVILDLGLPDMDGIDLLRQLRQAKVELPVLVLTARDQIEDKLQGLDTGADDYMVKPFDIRELEARIRTLTRRQQGRRSELIQVGKAQLDLATRQLKFADLELDFSRREFALVQAFFERPGKIVTRESLASHSYGWDDEIESNALEVHIHKLRKKLGNGAIKTVRGVGYMLMAEHFS